MVEVPESDGYECSARPMPLELWEFVLKRLPADAERRCLSVSRWFHHLVYPLVFSRITIHIGIWKADPDEGHITTDVQFIKRRIIRNSELFHHIESNTQFAQIVKGITVHAHDIGWSEEDIFAVIRVLQSLPHLRSFRWYGIPATMRSWTSATQVFDALARTCGPSLTELITTVTSDWGEDMFFLKFTSLQTLSFEGVPREYPDDVGPKMIACIVNVPSTLLSLSVTRYVIWDMPLGVFPRLHKLSLQKPPSLQNLGVVLEHCPQLRTLDIVTSSLFSGPQVCTALKAVPEALPHLTSFKLLCLGDAFISDFAPVLAFVRNKKAMRRLDLRFDVALEDLDEYTRFLDIFVGLTQLEVVGLTLQGEIFTREHRMLLDKRLPLRLSALLLTWAFRSPDDAALKRDWVSTLTNRPLLGYLHVLDRKHNLDLRDLLLEDYLPALQLVGYGTRLNWIQRDSPIDEAVYGAPWDDRRVAFRTAEDFQYEDWEWLLRGHID
ncbi:hypothetical protein TRAPUB_6338 [Trametes pubescens]|uniref:F-box domain-containing protein n=1 Tax=Trametes pubescens TaxID=154538 RepID=A0A1M2V645_TRAPU|nr:hypothetical protein TRAPUB_6338 [Trametes pubescens]